MIRIIIIAILQLAVSRANSQLTKNNWMVGGNLSYSRSQSIGADAINTKNRVIDLYTNLGYFPIDKLGIGIAINSKFTKEKYPEINGTTRISNQNKHGFGPFIRYYFLPVEKRVNILSEGSFIYSILSVNNSGTVQGKYKTNDWNFFVGPVIFFNSFVGMELLAGYNYSKAMEFDSRRQTIILKIGFQIHLEND